jgi:hypothetical protein
MRLRNRKHRHLAFFGLPELTRYKVLNRTNTWFRPGPSDAIGLPAAPNGYDFCKTIGTAPKRFLLPWWLLPAPADDASLRSSSLRRRPTSRAPMTIRFDSPERRRAIRGHPLGEPRRPELTQRIMGMYAEMPGLRLTTAQAARLLGISQQTAAVVLDDLARTRLLGRDTESQYLLPAAR